MFCQEEREFGNKETEDQGLPVHECRAFMDFSFRQLEVEVAFRH